MKKLKDSYLIKLDKQQKFYSEYQLFHNGKEMFNSKLLETKSVQYFARTVAAVFMTGNYA